MNSFDPYRTPKADVAALAPEGVDGTSPFSPAGRFGRLSYIAWGIVLGLVGQLATLLAGGAPTFDPGGQPEMAMTAIVAIVIVGIVSLVIGFIFVIRRCHDVDAAGWWSLLVLVPLANLFFFLFLLFKRGTEGANRFGPARITPGWEKVLGYVGIALFVIALIGIVAAIAIPAYMDYMTRAGAAL